MTISHRNRYVHHTAKLDGNRTTDLRERYFGLASIYISEPPDFSHKVERWHNVLFIAQSTTECSDRRPRKPLDSAMRLISK